MSDSIMYIDIQAGFVLHKKDPVIAGCGCRDDVNISCLPLSSSLVRPGDEFLIGDTFGPPMNNTNFNNSQPNQTIFLTNSINVHAYCRAVGESYKVGIAESPEDDTCLDYPWDYTFNGTNDYCALIDTQPCAADVVGGQPVTRELVGRTTPPIDPVDEAEVTIWYNNQVRVVIITILFIKILSSFY